MPNPWNAAEPFDLSNLWVASKPIVRSMCIKVTGRWRGWHPYVLDKYLWPAVTAAAGVADPAQKRFDHARIKRPEQYRCLVLGSAEGKMSGMLNQWGFAGEIIVADVADNALERARAASDRLGFRNVHYLHLDLETEQPPGRFDFIICDGVLHHITNIERCLAVLAEALDDDGILIAAEFVGPVRFQLPELQERWINILLGIMPRGMMRRGPPGGDPLLPLSAAELGEPYRSVLPEVLATFDPSEAASGPKLKQLMPAAFDLLEHCPTGGTLTTYLHDFIDYKKTNTPPYDKWMEVAISIEGLLVDTGQIESDYVFYVGRRQR